MDFQNILGYRPGVKAQVSVTNATSGNTQIVPASPNTRFNILHWALTFSKACNVKFTDGTADLTGKYQIPASGLWSNSNIMIPASGYNRPIDIYVDTSVSAIEGNVWYDEVPLYLKQSKSVSGGMGAIARGAQSPVAASGGV